MPPWHMNINTANYSLNLKYEENIIDSTFMIRVTNGFSVYRRQLTHDPVNTTRTDNYHSSFIIVIDSAISIPLLEFHEGFLINRLFSSLSCRHDLMPYTLDIVKDIVLQCQVKREWLHNEDAVI
jgi:hypothetical protein